MPKAISFMGDPIKVDTVAEAMTLKPGDHVLIDITMVDCCYMVYSEDNKETARYYIAMFFDTDLLVDYGLTVRVGRDYYSQMEEAIKACDDFFNAFVVDMSTPLPTKSYLTIDGVVEEFKADKEKEYAKEYVTAGYMDYIYVVPNTKSASFIIIAIAGVFVLVGAVLIILFFIGRKKDKERLEEIRSSNPGYYETPNDVSFNNSSYTGSQNTYGFDPSTDPRFNGRAQGNPGSSNNYQYSTAQNDVMNFNEVGTVQNDVTQFNEIDTNSNDSMQFNEVTDQSDNNDNLNDQ